MKVTAFAPYASSKQSRKTRNPTDKENYMKVTIKLSWAIRGGIKKNKLLFFRKTPKGGRGGLAQSKISLSEKN